MYICTIRSRDVRRVVRRGADSRVPRADEAAVVTKHPETLRDGEPCATAVRCVCTVAPTVLQLDQTWTRERVCVCDTHTHTRARARKHTHRERERTLWVAWCRHPPPQPGLEICLHMAVDVRCPAQSVGHVRAERPLQLADLRLPQADVTRRRFVLTERAA